MNFSSLGTGEVRQGDCGERPISGEQLSIAGGNSKGDSRGGKGVDHVSDHSSSLLAV